MDLDDVRTAVGSSPLQVPATIAKLQRCLERWYTQMLFLLLSALHCIAYFLTTPEDSEQLQDKQLRNRAIWAFTTSCPVIILTVVEFLVRVRSQGGPIMYLTSWKEFFGTRFHRLEVFILCTLGVRVCFSCHTVYLAAASGELSADFEAGDRLTVMVVLFYRFFRAWELCLGVSVENTKKKRVKYTQTKYWMDDHTKKKAKYMRRPSVRMQGYIDGRHFQVVMAMLLLVFLICYSLPRTLDDVHWLSQYAVPAGYLLNSFYFMEFVVRATAQGGEAFFIPVLHRIEIVILVTGVFCTFYATWYHKAIMDSRKSFEPSGAATGSILSIHRLLRWIGIHLEISGSPWDSFGFQGAIAVKTFMKRFGRLLEVPPQNVTINSNFNGTIELRICKAKLNHNALNGLHLPVSVHGALVEEIYIHLPQPSFSSCPEGVEDGAKGTTGEARRSEEKAKTMVVKLKHLFLILHPGDGLAEAGGFEEGLPSSARSYWTYENLLNAKSKIVELVVETFSLPDKPSHSKVQPVESVPIAVEETRAKLGGLSAVREATWETIRRYKDRMRSFAQQVAVKHVDVSIWNVTMQFEDTQCRLGRGHMNMGLRVGSVRFRRDQDRRLALDAARLGVYIETQSMDHAMQGFLPPTPSNLSLSTTKTAWRAPLSFAMDDHPSHVMDMLRHINCAEMLRLAAFEAMHCQRYVSEHQQHLLAERWPEYRLVFSVLQVSLHAGPMEHSAVNDSRTGAVSGTSSYDAKSHKNALWSWDVKTKPVRVTLDDEQARCLMTVVSCCHAWNRLDDAFRWRPNVKVSLEGPSHDQLPLERSSVAQLWWMYAVRRVLARLGLRLRLPWLSVRWQAVNVRCYSALLTELARRGAKWEDWEKRWLQELELRIPVSDALRCRRKAKMVTVTESAERRTTGASLFRGDSRRTVETKPATQKGTLNVEELDIKRSKSAISLHSVKSAATNATNRIESSIEALLLDPDPEVETFVPRATINRRSTLASVRGSWKVFIPGVEVRILKWGKRPRPVLLHFRIAVIEMHAEIQELCDEFEGADNDNVCWACTATVQNFGASCPQAGPLLLGGSCHIFTVTRGVVPPLPQQPGLLSDATTENGACRQSALTVRTALFQSGRGICEWYLPDMRIVLYEPLFLTLLRYVRKPRIVSRWTSVSRTQGQSFTTPTAVATDAAGIGTPRGAPIDNNNTGFAAGCTDAGGSDKAGFGAAYSNAVGSAMAGDKIPGDLRFPQSRIKRQWKSGGVIVANGRLGPVLSSSIWHDVWHDDGEETARLTDWRSSVRGLAQRVRMARLEMEKNHKWQQRFEVLSTFRSIDEVWVHWDVRLHAGAMHLVQVGAYSTRSLVVEEYRFWPWCTRTGGGKTVAAQSMPLSRKASIGHCRFSESTTTEMCHGPRAQTSVDPVVFFEFNGFDNGAVLPWEDPRWVEPWERPGSEDPDVGPLASSATKLLPISDWPFVSIARLSRRQIARSAPTSHVAQSAHRGSSEHLTGHSVLRSCCSGGCETSSGDCAVHKNLPIVGNSEGLGQGAREQNTQACEVLVRVVDRNLFSTGWLNQVSARWRDRVFSATTCLAPDQQRPGCGDNSLGSQFADVEIVDDGRSPNRRCPRRVVYPRSL